MSIRQAEWFQRLLAITLCGYFIGSAYAEEIRLGGIRDAVAEITTHGENLECEISFIPVRVFDKPMNAGINRTKAEFYCRRALIMWSKIPDGATVTFRGLRPVGSKNGDVRYSQVFAIPKDGIEEDASAISKSPSTERKEIGKPESSVATGGSLLTRVDDHMSTINSIAQELRNTLTSQPSFPTTEDPDAATADLEQRIRDAMEASRKAAISDRLLLGIEKSMISTHIDQLQNELIQQLALLYKARSNNN